MLGTCPYPFPRLLEWIGDLVDRNSISKDQGLYIQHGYTPMPKSIQKYSWVKFTPSISKKELRRLIIESDLVVSHAGQGLTSELAKSNIPFVIVPRLKRFGEHVDDHQLYFAKSVEQFSVIHCLDFEQLEKAVENPPQELNISLFPGPKLVDYLINTYGDI